MISSATPDYKFDCKLDTASLIREQDRLRLESLRHLEQLRIRRDSYQSCRVLQRQLPHQSNVNHEAGWTNTSSGELVVGNGESKTLIYGDSRRYQPVSATVKLSSSQGFAVLNNSIGSVAPSVTQPVSNSQLVSASAVLSDDLHNKKWSASATQEARKKLLSGRSQTHFSVNNSSSVDACSGSGPIEPALVSNTFTDSSGASKVLGLETDAAGYFLSDDMHTAKGNGCTTPQKFDQSLEGTPKSILRHRQIIDRNVPVESKFDHTPTTNVRSRKHRRGLNFSYSDVDDAQLFGRKTKSVNFDVDSEKIGVKLNSQAADLSCEASSPDEQTQLKLLAASSSTLPSSQRFYCEPDSAENSVDARNSSTAVNGAAEGLLLQTETGRQNAKIICELENRPHSGLFSVDQPLVTGASGSQVLGNYICCFVLKLIILKYLYQLCVLFYAFFICCVKL